MSKKIQDIKVLLDGADCNIIELTIRQRPEEGNTAHFVCTHQNHNILTHRKVRIMFDDKMIFYGIPTEIESEVIDGNVFKTTVEATEKL